jgi:hypothetical protein
MPADPRKRQRKLQRLAAKRKEKKHQLAKKQEMGLAERLAAATKYLVLHARISEALEDSGIGYVLLSRQLPGGSVAVGLFLVDRYCLGVKNAFGHLVSGSSYEREILRKMDTQSRWRDVAPATVRKVVEAAVAYAAELGLSPHSDYPKVKPIFGDIDPGESTESVEFGKDGKPLFVPGPYDTPERCRQIVAMLTHSRGPDGFDYLMAFRGLGLDGSPRQELTNEQNRLPGGS